MASHDTSDVAGGIGRIFAGGSLAGLSDSEVLRRFTRGDEAAFEAMIARYGPPVLAACRRRLHEEQDAEDAFQATFLVLLRRAGSLRDPDLLGPWLHGVAGKVSARIQSRAARRKDEERKAVRTEGIAEPQSSRLESTELREAIDAEIARLPERDRRAVVLCLLEGRSHDEAARRLRCTVGSVRGRLDKARRTLKGRLIRRGVAPASAAAMIAAAGEAKAAVPARLTAETASMLANAANAEAISAAIAPGVLSASQGVIRGMLAARLTAAAAVVLGLGLLAMAAAPLVVAIEPAPRIAAEPPRQSAPKLTIEEGLSMTGRVTDESGDPIAGATVAIGRDFREKAPDAEATTNADGRFALKSLAAGPIVLTVQAKGHAPDLLSTTAAAGMKLVEFELKPPHVIRGRIVDPDGKPIADAPIAADEWRGQHTLRWQTRTDAEGRFRWEDAPGDSLLIDLGTLGFSSKRLWQATPDAPEKTFSMCRPLRVRGKVTDAETGRSILEYTLVPGESSPGSIGAPQWANDQFREIRGSSFEVNLSTDRPYPVVRIEARGYLPAVSQRLDDPAAEATVDFALRKGPWIEGKVELPDGSPAAGAEVIVSSSGRRSLSNGRLTIRTGPYRIFTTRSDGRFSLPPTEPPDTILVIHDCGLATGLDATAGRPSSPALKIRLEPWGRVEGRLLLGGRPAAGQSICIFPGGPGDQPSEAWWGDIKTDAQGRFVLNRIAAGKVKVSRKVLLYEGTYGNIPPTEIGVVQPGETLELTLGATGQTIVGEVKRPAELPGRKDRRPMSGFLSGRSAVVAGARQPGMSSDFPIEADGSFRIEGLPPATYDLEFRIQPNPSQGPFVQTYPGIAHREVVIPDQPSGPDTPPLDLGTITLERVK